MKQSVVMRGGSVVGGSRVYPHQSDRYRLVFEDDFNGAANSSPNPANWFNEEGDIRPNEPQYYTVNRPENCRLSGNSTLILEARKESYLGFDYTSASLRSQGLQEFTYGRFEAMIKLPTGDGVFPAWWLLGANIGTVGWPACGEYDIMEYVGNQATTLWAGNVHCTTPPTGRTTSFTLSDPSSWHKYWCEWTPTGIDCYIDSTLLNSFANDSGGLSTYPFVNPSFMMLNLALGGWGGSNPVNDAIFSSSVIMECDWVRVYQRF